MSIILNTENIIGCDETGVGDYFTPLIAVAAYIPKKNIDKVLELNIKDSKLLNNRKIMNLYWKLKDLIFFGKYALSQQGYNKLNESFNAHELKTIAHINAIHTLKKKVTNIDYIVMDQYCSEKSWQKYVKHINETQYIKLPKIDDSIHFHTKAESKYLAVAVAAIIARAILLFLMKEQNQKYNFNFPLGANDIVITKARDFIKIHGNDKLSLVAKIKFKTTEKI